MADPMMPTPLPVGMPLTYDECRQRFRGAGHLEQADVTSYPIAARGPQGQILTIDVARFGRPTASSVLVVMSGVHGIEGFAGSMLQCDNIVGLPARLAADQAVVMVHAVNPWGMAQWRRQNESNVDLNRNWDRSNIEPPDNERYEMVHPLLCPDTATQPSAASFVDPVADLVAAHGAAWVEAAISVGQYRHADGLYFGGVRTEESTELLGTIVDAQTSAAGHVTIVDLHTGHGRYGTSTILSDLPSGAPDDVWLRRHFAGFTIETSIAGASAGTPSLPPVKVGQLAHGLARRLDAATHTVTFELGTAGGRRMILAERAEHWAYRHGWPNTDEVRDIRWEHRECSAPSDPEWQAGAVEHGRALFRSALAAASTPG